MTFHSPKFQPSEHSLGCGYGDIALTNRGMVAVTGKVSKAATLALFTGGATLAADALKSKDARYAEARAQADKFKMRYNKCAKKRREKGKSLYPNNPGKGPFFTDCREKHKEWKHYENKAASLAKSLQEKLARKDKLDVETAKMLTEAQSRPAKIAESEYKDSVKDWEDKSKTGKKGGGQKNRPNRKSIQAAAFDPEGTAQTLEGEGDDGFPIWLIGLGAVAALGGVAYYVLAD